MEPQVAGGGEVVAPARTVTHYELLEKLGEGGMGSVFKARDTRLERLVALKFPLPRLLDSPDLRTRFMREGRALSSLSHPNIATVFEVDEAGGTPFLALEYLPGGTLRGRVRAAAGSGLHIPFGEIVDWSVGIADGLAHAHRHGIVHRDVKSGNVMFGAEGRVKLTDFGLAKVTGGGEHSTSGMVVGTFAYMSPEQASGGVVDQRSDLYSLGVVMYEAATGRMPFEGDSPAVAYQILNKEPAPPSRLRPELPSEFDRVVLKLLDKAPARRYQRGEELVRDLRALPGAGEKSILQAVTITLAEPLRWQGTRRRWLAATALAVLLATAGAYTGYRPVQRWLRARALPQQKSVAILPCQVTGQDAARLASCDGLMQAMVLEGLTRHGGLSVVPAVDSRQPWTVERARRELGVNLVLAGSVEYRGEQVRLSLTLTDARTERPLETLRVDWAFARLADAQDTLLTKLGDLLNLAFPRGPQSIPASLASQVPSAQDHYLRGRGFLYRYDKKENLENAKKEFHDALVSDPGFAAAYVGLAQTHLHLHRYFGRAEDLTSAREAAESALKQNAKLAGAHMVLGSVYTASGRPADSIRELEAARSLDPLDPATYRELARVYRQERRDADAEAAYLEAIRARPWDWQSHNQLAIFYYQHQQYANAERRFKDAVERGPDNHILYRNLGAVLFDLDRTTEAEKMSLKSLELKPAALAGLNLGAIYMWDHRYSEAVTAMENAASLAARDAPKSYRLWGNLGDSYWLAGYDQAKSRQAWQKAVEICKKLAQDPAEDRPLVLSYLAKYQAKLGHHPESLARITEALKGAPEDASIHYQATLVYTVLGNTQRAFQELQAAVKLGYAEKQIRAAPELEPLRQDPRFEQIISSGGGP